MIVRWLALAISSCALIVSPLAAADDGPVLAPSSKWVLGYDADSCSLRRTFGSGEDQVFLEMRRFEPSLGLQTIIANTRARSRSQLNVQYRFTGDEDWRKTGPDLSVTLDDGLKGAIVGHSLTDLPELEDMEPGPERDAYLSSIDFKTIERQRAATIDSLSVRGLGPEFTLRLGNLEAPIVALQDCVDELTAHWNIDVEAHKTLTRRASPIDWKASSRMLDYPPRMQQQHMPGLVNVRLAIDDAGKITACSIQMPLSDPDFEESSCADIQHAFEFDPALDKDGKPIASYWTTRVIFSFGL